MVQPFKRAPHISLRVVLVLHNHGWEMVGDGGRSAALSLQRRVYVFMYVMTFLFTFNQTAMDQQITAKISHY
jgi:hypothetical protein